MANLLTGAPLFVITLFFTFLVVLILAVITIGKQDRRILYVLAVLVPAVWLLLPPLVAGFEPSGAAWLSIFGALRSDFRAWYWMPLFLWFVVFMVIIWGDPQSFSSHKEIIAPRRAVWTAFALIMFGIMLWVPYNILNVNQQASGVHATFESLIDAIDETQDYANNLVDGVHDRSLQERAPGSYAGKIAGLAGSAEAQALIVVRRSETLAQSLAQQLPELESAAQETNLSEDSRDVQKAKQMIAALEQLTRLANEIALHSGELSVSANAITGEIPDAESSRMMFLADEIKDIAGDMAPISSVLALDRASPFAIIMLLFVIFLLIPWLLYLSFMVSKRATLVRDSRTTLQQLGLIDRLIEAPAPQRDEEQRISRLVAREMTRAWKELVAFEKTNPAIFDPQRSWSAQDWQQGQLALIGAHIAAALAVAGEGSNPDHSFSLPSLAKLGELFDLDPAGDLTPKRAGTRPQVIRHHVEAARDEALEQIIRFQRFHSREYIIPLVLLTLLTAVGWYYTYLPNALTGLTQLILDGATLQRLTIYLTSSFTPITMTFAGAWLFIIVMLMNRWAEDDLFPRSFFYAALRLVVAFLVGLLFASWFGSDGDYSTTQLVLAFAVGAAPFEFINAVFRSLAKSTTDLAGSFSHWFQQRFVSEFKPPEWDSKHRLTVLEDLTIWDDIRLYQEGIKNIHGLATADLDRLVLNTPFNAQQLIDWVDQALLYVHAKDLWRPGLSAICVRTGSDLLEFCLVNGHLETSRIEKLVEIYDQVEGAGSTADDPLRETRAAAGNIQSSAGDVQKKAEALLTTAQALETDKPAGQEKLNLLQEQLGDNGLSGAITTLETSRAETVEKLSKLQAPDAQALAKAQGSLEELGRQIAGLAKTMQETSSTVAVLSVDATDGLEEAKNKLVTVAQSAGEVSAKSVSAAKETSQASAPQQLTAGVLEIMLKGLMRDPNMSHVNHFWRRSGFAFR